MAKKTGLDDSGDQKPQQQARKPLRQANTALRRPEKTHPRRTQNQNCYPAVMGVGREGETLPPSLDQPSRKIPPIFLGSSSKRS